MPEPLTDFGALARNRARACDDGLFLHNRVRDEIHERLKEVNRAFTAPAIVTPFPSVWQTEFVAAKFIPEAEVLDLAPGAHDLVIHALSLHWANDPVGQLIQCRRALRPDGLLIAAMFGGQTLNELRTALAEAEAAVRGGLSPRILPMGDLRDLGSLLVRAGLNLAVADSDRLEVKYRNINALMRDIRAMGEGNSLTTRPRNFTGRNLFSAAAESYETHFGTPDGLPASFEIIYLTGWAPSNTQQVPLRPGSAVARLADALSTDETPL